MAIPNNGPGQPEGSAATATDELQRVRSCIEQLQQEVFDLRDQNRRLRQLRAEAEEESSRMARQFVALSQLNLASNYQEAVNTVHDILTNLIGTEEFAYLMLRKSEPRFDCLFSMGIEESLITGLKMDTEQIRQALESGTPVVCRSTRPARADEILAVVPLMVEDKAVGAIVIFGLSPQKNGLEPRDFPLFDLLSRHAVTSIASKGEGDHLCPRVQ